MRREFWAWLALFLLVPEAAQAAPVVAAVVWFATSSSILAVAARFVVQVAIMIFSRRKPSGGSSERQAQTTQLQLGEGPRVCVFGTACVGGTFLDGFNFGGQYGTDWEVLVIVLADHRCHSLLGFYVGDRYVPFTANGAVAGYNGQLEVHFRDGRLDQDGLPAHLLAGSAGTWTEDDNVAGCAYVAVAYKADAQDARNPIWTGGRPSFRWVLKGKLCYIARLDSSVGGSGTHRWDDPDTWEWTDNLIDCRYNFTRGIYAGDQVDDPAMLMFGRGLTAIEAPPENTFAPANICDEAIELEDETTEPRYVCSAAIGTDQAFIDVEEDFAAACGGWIVQREGGVEIEPGYAKAAAFTFTDDDLIIGEPVTIEPFLPATQRVNTVIGRYIEPDQGWASHSAPIKRDLDDITADGGPMERTLELPFVPSGTQAQRLAEIERSMARLERRATVTLGPRFSHIEETDWGVWESARRFDGDDPTFLVEGWRLSPGWRITLSLREIHASCFDDLPETTPDTDPQTPPDELDPLELSVTAVELVQIAGQSGQSTPAVRFAWETPVDPGMSGVRGEVAWFTGALTDVDGEIITDVDGFPITTVDGATGEPSPTTTNDPNRGALIATNGVVPGLSLVARAVPIALDRGRGVQPSPWVEVGTGDTVTTPGGGEGVTWGEDSTTNNATAGTTHVAIAQVPLTGVGAAPLIEAEISVTNVPLTTLSAGTVFNGGWELVEQSGATTTVMESGTFTATDTGGGFIDIVGDWPSGRFEVGAGTLSGAVNYALRVWRTSGTNNVSDFNATLFIRRS